MRCKSLDARKLTTTVECLATIMELVKQRKNPYLPDNEAVIASV